MVAIVAACGGSPPAGKARIVQGKGFTYEAPVGGGSTVEVRTFSLARPYSPALFELARPEIERVAKQVQAKVGGTLEGRAVTVAGRKTWQYDLVHGDVFEQLTFVLQGKREYELYCRRGKGDSNRPCERLLATFRLR
jgi:hypothetical protein